MTELLCTGAIASALKPCHQSAHVYIGYSGGIDSHVLLHLCAATPFKDKITAVYVHHGLQADADAWAWHCQATAASLGVNFKVLRVDATARPGESPEEAARNARYTALKSLIRAGDVLLLAQHRDDQLETVLLQLFRGSGLRGLSAMPESSAFGPGLMLRPLLNSAKSAIDDYARAHALQWVDDPSNLSDEYDRNFLRNAVLPLLKQRWPACDKTVARSAKHCADAQQVVSKVAEQLFCPVYNAADQTLGISQLKAYEPVQQALVIRQWLHTLGLKMPAVAFIENLQTQVLNAKATGDPALAIQGYVICRYRDKLYCLHALPETVQATVWPWGLPSINLSEQLSLTSVPASTGISYRQWQSAVITIKPRRGGEKIRLHGRKGHHALKKLFQEADIPPWQRAAMPLIYLDGQLAAVGDLWISADFYSETEACIRLSLHSKASGRMPS